eukprot:1158317-Pelagomonas_calceolata.AAC.12
MPPHSPCIPAAILSTSDSAPAAFAFPQHASPGWRGTWQCPGGRTFLTRSPQAPAPAGAGVAQPASAAAGPCADANAIPAHDAPAAVVAVDAESG